MMKTVAKKSPSCSATSLFFLFEVAEEPNDFVATVSGTAELLVVGFKKKVSFFKDR